MIQKFFSRLLTAVLLVLLQVLVFDHIHFLGYAMPFVYIYLVLQFPKETPRWVTLCWGFVVGLVVDVFCNTPGVAAASLTALAMMQPLLLKMFSSRVSDDESWEPGAQTMGWGAFSRYTIAASLLYVTLFFAIESFSFANARALFLNILGSFLITSLLILAFEHFRSSKKQARSL